MKIWRCENIPFYVFLQYRVNHKEWMVICKLIKPGPDPGFRQFSGTGVHMQKGVGVSFADFISFFF